ncbi:hypothetical protein PBY51_011650 [Eleginops maclovinus]|uniref:Uncharacterized protein n=1 Tax=Eleginops maclovinus TaxID=56733 RepID=A0AAN8ATZ7_ELEMC|nr:hypothetical protein PBY51_011650 [Eleginops maclovinus]
MTPTAALPLDVFYSRIRRIQDLSRTAHEAAVTTAADAQESSNGQVSENRSGAALRQSSQPAPSCLGTSPTI